MDDCSADLAFDIVADQRYAALVKPLPPSRIFGNEYRNTVDKPAASAERLLGIPPGCSLGTNRQVRDDDLGAGRAQRTDDVVHRLRRLDHRITQVAADSVMGRAATDFDPGRRHCGETFGVVGRGGDGLREVSSDLPLGDIEGGNKLDIPHMVTANV